MFVALAKLQLPCGDPFEQDEQAMMLFEKWGESNVIHIDEVSDFFEACGTELQLWKISHVSDHPEATKLCLARTDNYLDVIVPEHWNSETQAISAHDVRVCYDKLFFRGFYCNRDKCSYSTRRRDNLENHEENHKTDRMEYKCIRFGAETENYLDILPQSYNCNNVAVFDIESLMQPLNGMQVHVPVMVALLNNFILQDEKSIICRFDMTGEGMKQLVSELLDKLVYWCEMHKSTIPRKAHTFVAKAKHLLSEKISGAQKRWYKKRLLALEDLLELKVLGFNSMKYDTLALSNAIIDIAMERYGKDSVQCVKKGMGIFNLRIRTGTVDIAFRDVLSYIPKQSLDKFAASWGVKTSKLVWPYQLYRNGIHIFSFYGYEYLRKPNIF